MSIEIDKTNLESSDSKILAEAIEQIGDKIEKQKSPAQIG